MTVHALAKVGLAHVEGHGLDVFGDIRGGVILAQTGELQGFLKPEVNTLFASRFRPWTSPTGSQVFCLVPESHR